LERKGIEEIIMPTFISYIHLLFLVFISTCRFIFVESLVTSSSCRHPILDEKLRFQCQRRSYSRSSHLPMIPDSTMPFLNGNGFLTAVDVFDGSTIDPIVVSGAFWAGMKGKVLSLIVGQVLAASVFAIISSIFATQIAGIGEFVQTKLFKDSLKEKASDFSNSIQTSINTRTRSSSASPDFGKLFLCLMIDAIGTSSELVPVLGEVTDVVWAPIAALGLRNLYGSNVVFALEFVEEILPFTDFIPLATVCWVVDSFYGDTDIAKSLQIGQYGKNYDSGSVIDIPKEGMDRDDTKISPRN